LPEDENEMNDRANDDIENTEYTKDEEKPKSEEKHKSSQKRSAKHRKHNRSSIKKRAPEKVVSAGKEAKGITIPMSTLKIMGVIAVAAILIAVIVFVAIPNLAPNNSSVPAAVGQLKPSVENLKTKVTSGASPAELRAGVADVTKGVQNLAYVVNSNNNADMKLEIAQINSRIAEINDILNKNIDISGQVQDLQAKVDDISSRLDSISSDVKPSGGTIPSREKARVEFYVMSKCPYGTQVEDAIKPVLDKLGSSVDFSIDFIADDKGDGTFQSLHGATEVSGNIVQLCAMKYDPQKYMDMVVCMNKDAASIPNNWEKCAQDNGLDTTNIKGCYEGAEGKTLLSASIKASAAKNAQGSPTIFINDQPYEGDRSPASFQRTICNSIKSNPECANMPTCVADTDCPAVEGKIAKCTSPNTKSSKCDYVDPVEVGLTIVNTKDCTSCDSTKMETVLKQLFPGAKISYVDAASTEGKKLITDMKLVYAPSYVFDSRLEKTETWTTNKNIQSAFEKVGNSYKIVDTATGATFYLSAEARAKAMADKGVTLGDNKPQLDFFVMSYCPYGNQADDAVAPVYQLLKGKAVFNPRYVIYNKYQGGTDQYCMDNGNYCSMHGIQELHQDIREICVNKYMGLDSYFKFVLAMNKQCNAQNADTCWEAVAKNMSLDTTKIKACEKDEGLAIVKEEYRLNGIWAVSGSPTIFVEGQQFNGARTADGIKAGLCQAFTTVPSECSTTIDAGAAPAATTAQGGCGV
jgi:protein-disulfide isomerase